MPLGGLVTLIILLPNLVVVFFTPVQAPLETGNQGLLYRLMEGIERTGQVSSFILPFLFPLPPLTGPRVYALAVMTAAALLYYAGWARYLIQGRHFGLLFAPMLGIPLPMAVGPVIYFAAAAVFFGQPVLAAAAVLLAIGHLWVSWRSYQRCKGWIHANPGTE